MRHAVWWWLAALCVDAVVGWAALGAKTRHHAAEPAWSVWPAAWHFQNDAFLPRPLLFDGEVLLWGAEQAEAGRNPAAPELVGDSGITYNYPAGWRVLAWLHLRRSDLLGFAWALALIYGGALFWVIPPDNFGAFLLHPLILISPPSLEALGQANGELLIIALVIASAKLAAKPGRLSEVVSPLALAVAAVLKLYPVIAFGVLALYRPARRVWTLLVGLLVCGWFVASFADVRRVASRTPEPSSMAFGCKVIPARAQNLLVSRSRWLDRVPHARWILGALAAGGWGFRALYAGAVLIGLAIGRRKAMAAGDGARGDHASGLLLAVGAILFIGAFGIGSSWLHRLLVVLPCVAGAWRRGEVRLLSLLVAGLWCGVLTAGPTFLLEQALMWCLLLALSVELGCWSWPRLRSAQANSAIAA